MLWAEGVPVCVVEGTLALQNSKKDLRFFEVAALALGTGICTWRDLKAAGHQQTGSRLPSCSWHLGAQAGRVLKPPSPMGMAAGTRGLLAPPPVQSLSGPLENLYFSNFSLLPLSMACGVARRSAWKWALPMAEVQEHQCPALQVATDREHPKWNTPDVY